MDKYKTYLSEFEKRCDLIIRNLLNALTKQFVNTHADGVILGMSGGLDCSVVAVLCKMADIPVQLIALPYGNSMKTGQLTDAELLASKFELPMELYPIDSVALGIKNFTTYFEMDSQAKNRTFNGNKDMACANIGPLTRMAVLSTLGQSMNYAMIGTGNLTERYIGNFTKRGDGQSDFNPIGNLTKSEIRIIARHIGIPERIITKAPSADLWEGQTDENEMGLRIEDIDRYLLTGTSSDHIIDEKIEQKCDMSLHKRNPIPTIQRTVLFSCLDLFAFADLY